MLFNNHFFIYKSKTMKERTNKQNIANLALKAKEGLGGL